MSIADEGQALNRDYRGKDYATNVLSFPYASAPMLSGDLVICAPVVEREPAEQGKSAGSPLRASDRAWPAAFAGPGSRKRRKDAASMENHERDILAALGYADPYAGGVRATGGKRGSPRGWISFFLCALCDLCGYATSALKEFAIDFFRIMDINPDKQPGFFERLSSLLLRKPEDRDQLIKLLHSAHERNLLDADALIDHRRRARCLRNQRERCHGAACPDAGHRH